jgi:hypothetical protein
MSDDTVEVMVSLTRCRYCPHGQLLNVAGTSKSLISCWKLNGRHCGVEDPIPYYCPYRRTSNADNTPTKTVAKPEEKYKPGMTGFFADALFSCWYRGVLKRYTPNIQCPFRMSTLEGEEISSFGHFIPCEFPTDAD